MTAAAIYTPPTLKLPEYTYKIPESAREWETDPKTVTIRSFPVGTELDAMNALTNVNAMAYELLQRCTVRQDGKAVDQGTNFIEQWSPKVRTLMTRAVNKRFLPTDKEVEDFLASEETVVP